jgi:hypothetical protein
MQVCNLTELNNNQQHTSSTRTAPYTNKARSCARWPSTEPLVRAAGARPGSSRTRVCGVEARCSSDYARQVTVLHHGQLAVHIGEADDTLVPRLGESDQGDFAEELHGPRTEPPQD